VLAALIATHPVGPPAPVLFYTDQLIAATNTFVCLTVCRSAGTITTSLLIQNTLVLSQPGRESILDQLDRFYYRIINYLSSNANMIDLPVDLYLSNQIAGAIATARVLTGILSTLPVAPQSVAFLVRLRNELALALANLVALGKPV